jgi:cell division protease FtsH
VRTAATPRGAAMNPKTRFNLVYVLIAVSSVFLLHDVWVRYQDVAAIPYSKFQQLVAQGKVKEVVVDEDSIEGELKEPLQEPPFAGQRRFATRA